MNQQRARRFRAVQETAEKNAIMRDILRDAGGGVNSEGDFDPEGSGAKEAWDSNVITPGTPFMHNLSDYLRWYIADRLNRGGEAWRRCTVILSDASEPGEGEHKIMNFIRRQRTLPGYDPNLRHVLHGLDADLIMLGLALHEAHFTVLREEVRFGREQHSQSKASADQDTFDKLTGNGGILAVDDDARWCYVKPFVMCHISVLREYLAVEFGMLASSLPFEFDFERIVDDFVFICFFVGNDFLPHLPTLDIRDGAIDFLNNVYKRVLPTLGDYLTSPGGVVNLENVDVILAEVGAIEDEVFRRRKGADDAEKVRSAQIKARRQVGIPGGAAGIERLALIASGLAASATAVGQYRCSTEPAAPASSVPALAPPVPAPVSSRGAQEPESRNQSAAASLRASLLGGSSRAKPAGEPEPAVELAEVEPRKPSAEEKDARAASLKAAFKLKEQAMLDEYKEKIEDEVRFWEAGWKDRYYADKYKEKDIASGGGRERVFREYIRGLCWVMKYYYAGCASWKWYYPFHYAPFASDLRNIERYSTDFDDSEPFKPIEQLMAVLPKESHHALPPPCHDLMLKPDSPIADFYPEDVEIDPNGKAMPWLWVTLLPFIDEERLLANLALVSPLFDDAARDRNRFRASTLYVHADFAPLGRAVAELALGQSAALDCAAVGLGGTITVPDPAVDPHGFVTHVRRPGAPTEGPPGSRAAPAGESRVASLSFADPPPAPHRSELLPGAVLPPPRLGLADMQIRVPRINRGMSISDLGFGSGRPFPAPALPRHNFGGHRAMFPVPPGAPLVPQHQPPLSLPPAKRSRMESVGAMYQPAPAPPHHQRPMHQPQPQTQAWPQGLAHDVPLGAAPVHGWGQPPHGGPQYAGPQGQLHHHLPHPFKHQQHFQHQHPHQIGFKPPAQPPFQQPMPPAGSGGLGALRAGLAQTLLRRPPPNQAAGAPQPFQHHRPSR